MSNTINCPGCNRRRKALGQTLMGAALCRPCTANRMSKRLGRLVLLTAQGKDSLTGQTFEELLEEMAAVGRDRW